MTDGRDPQEDGKHQLNTPETVDFEELEIGTSVTTISPVDGRTRTLCKVGLIPEGIRNHPTVTGHTNTLSVMYAVGGEDEAIDREKHAFPDPVALLRLILADPDVIHSDRVPNAVAVSINTAKAREAGLVHPEQGAAHVRTVIHLAFRDNYNFIKSVHPRRKLQGEELWNASS